MGLSITTKDALIQKCIGKDEHGVISSAYLALYTDDPDNNGKELGGDTTAATGYARSFLGDYQSGNNHKMTDASNGQSVNRYEIHFNENTHPTASWPSVSYGVIFGQPTGGSPVIWGKILNNDTPPAPTTVTCGPGHVIIIPAYNSASSQSGGLVIRFETSSSNSSGDNG